MSRFKFGPMVWLPLLVAASATGNGGDPEGERDSPETPDVPEEPQPSVEDAQPQEPVPPAPDPAVYAAPPPGYPPPPPGYQQPPPGYQQHPPPGYPPPPPGYPPPPPGYQQPPPGYQQPPPGYQQPPPGYPPQPGYQYQPAPYQVEEAKKKNKGCLIALIVVIVLIAAGIFSAIAGLSLIGNFFNSITGGIFSEDGGDGDGDGGFLDNIFGSGPGATGDIRTPVGDGQFTFRVEDIECGLQRVDGRTAQGEFCLLDVSVQNTGNQPRPFMIEVQRLIDEQGIQAMGIAWLSNDEITDSLDPGMRVVGKVLFDVASGARIVAAQLHDSPFSNGATIRLR